MPEEPDLSSVKFHLRTPVYRYHQYQGQTNDCGPTSLAIAANAILDDERFQGGIVADKMSKIAFESRPVPHLVVRRIRNWATFPWGITHYLKQHGFSAKWSPLGSVEKLLHNIRSNVVTIVIIGEPLKISRGRFAGWAHAKVLFGYTPGNGFLFVDPAEKKSSAQGPQYWKEFGLTWQDEKEFITQWKGMLRISIDVGRPFGY